MTQLATEENTRSHMTALGITALAGKFRAHAGQRFTREMLEGWLKEIAPAYLIDSGGTLPERYTPRDLSDQLGLSQARPWKDMFRRVIQPGGRLNVRRTRQDRNTPIPDLPAPSTTTAVIGGATRVAENGDLVVDHPDIKTRDEVRQEAAAEKKEITKVDVVEPCAKTTVRAEFMVRMDTLFQYLYQPGMSSGEVLTQIMRG